LYRKDFDWRWHPYHEKAYSHLEEQGELLLKYLNSPRPQHVWPDGTRIFAKGWGTINEKLRVKQKLKAVCGVTLIIRKRISNMVKNM
uniref:Transposase n=1 Tax=Elaeophora elaphi TaxID=1147741 RepID=A0A0R3RNE2_9BILA